MEGVRTFLESSTIHGLGYISTTRKLVKLFWIIVVIAGFTGASIMIYQSFKDWSDNPVTTTIETRPIKEIAFPKVTVCPPRNTYTDLNYDLMMTQNMTLDDEIKDELIKYATEQMNDHVFNTIMRNLSNIQEKDRYYNWYHGITKIELPSYTADDGTYSGNEYSGVNYYVTTYASSGTIFSQYFGDKFDADKVEPQFYNEIKIRFSEELIDNPNVTLCLNIELVALKDLSTGKDTIGLDACWMDDKGTCARYFQDSYTKSVQIGDVTHVGKNYTPPNYPQTTTNVYIDTENQVRILLNRKDVLKNVKKQSLRQMPGFRATWYLTENGMEVKPEKYYSSDEKRLAFVRKNSIISIGHISIL